MWRGEVFAISDCLVAPVMPITGVHTIIYALFPANNTMNRLNPFTHSRVYLQLQTTLDILILFAIWYMHRSVDELTFYILRWVNNVFHILLKIQHIIVWFGPNCLGKSTQSFRIYDMIKNIPEMSFSPCVYNRKNVHYVVNRII